MLDLNDDRCIILEFPGSTEDPGLDLSRIAYKLTTGHFEEADYAELLRAQDVREEQYAQLYHEMEDLP